MHGATSGDEGHAAELVVAERKERDLERLAHDERYDVLFTHSPWPNLVCDRETLRIVDANQACLQLYGYPREELLALTLYDLDGDRERLRRSFESLSEDFTALGEWTHRTKVGARVEVELLAHRLKAPRPAYLIVVRDVTQQRRLTEQLVQSQKMEAIGRLSGGIAHDFNNMLTAIFSYTEICLAKNADPTRFREDVEAIRSAAERASALTKQLLAFSRAQIMRTRPVDLNASVVEIERMLRQTIGEDIELVTELDPGLGTVTADPSQMSQILLNLAVNARDAMPLGGRLTIRTQNVEPGSLDARDLGALPSGRYVCLSVSDTGCGMDDATQRHIFEPFFTTKEAGKGTGLGMSTVFGIVTQTGGTIAIDSSPGNGARFRIYLPRSECPVPTAHDSGPQPARPRHSGTLVLVEDDDQVRRALVRLLDDRGFHVIPVRGKAEALAFLDGAHERVDVMVTDVVMPGGDGVSLAKEARLRLPELRVLFTSGYTDHAGLKDMRQANSRFLAKPFDGDALDLALQALMGSS